MGKLMNLLSILFLIARFRTYLESLNSNLGFNFDLGNSVDVKDWLIDWVKKAPSMELILESVLLGPYGYIETGSPLAVILLIQTLHRQQKSALHAK